MGTSFDYIPTVDMDRTQGLALKSKLEQGKVMIDFTKFNVTTTPGDEVNDSSSRGPSLPNFDIKPDVSAPGTNILSTVPSFAAEITIVRHTHNIQEHRWQHRTSLV